MNELDLDAIEAWWDNYGNVGLAGRAKVADLIAEVRRLRALVSS